MRKNPNNMTLDELEHSRKVIANAIKQKRKAERQEQEKRNTRRKIVAGAIALQTMERDPVFAAQFAALLEQYVSRDIDRELFGLLPKVSAQNISNESPNSLHIE